MHGKKLLKVLALVCLMVLLMATASFGTAFTGERYTPTPSPSPIIQPLVCENRCEFSIITKELLYPSNSFTFEITTGNAFEAQTYQWSLTGNANWIELSQYSGSLGPNDGITITATVDWNKVPYYDIETHIIMEGQSDTGNYTYASNLLVKLDNPAMTPLPTAYATPIPRIIKGTVMDKITLAPIANAHVFVTEQSRDPMFTNAFETFADQNGNYTIYAYDAGDMANFRAAVEANGYLQQLIQVNSLTKETTIDFTMTDTTNPLINLSLNSNIYASSTYSYERRPQMAVDGRVDTCWASALSTTGSTKAEWIYVDLGTVKEVKSLIIDWFDPYYAREYKVAVSNNGSDWTFVAHIKAGNGDIDTLTGDGTVRYVGLYLLRKNSEYAYAIDELKLMGLK